MYVEYSLVLLFFIVFIIFLFATGVVLFSFSRIRSLNSSGVACQMLIGYCFFNTLLFIMMFILPFSLITNACLLVFWLVILAVLKRERIVKTFMKTVKNSRYDLSAIVISFLAAILWGQGSIFPFLNVEEGVIFKPWTDSFLHASIINQIANWSGGSLQNIAVAGQTATPYHYAGYVSSALLKKVMHIQSYISFGAFHVPFGIFMTGVAGYVLMTFFWGKKAACLAVTVLLFAPDASQQGLNNPWLSYHWLQQIAPNGMYGIAICVLAWVFMLDACEKGLVTHLLLSYGLLAITLIYKAQIFVPNAILLWLWAPCFFGRLKSTQRLIWFLLNALILYFSIDFSQSDKRVPQLLFDGSAFWDYADFVRFNFKTEWLQTLLNVDGKNVEEKSSYLRIAIQNIFMIFFATFGAAGLMMPIILLKCWRKMNSAQRIFPIAVSAIYMAMTCLLAFDNRGIGTPEELLHRPFVWAYFAIVLWVFGGMFYFGEKKYMSWRYKRFIAGGLFIILISVPVQYGRGIALGPEFGKNFSNYLVPRGIIKTCDYVRNNSQENDVFQDSQADEKFVCAALSERQSFFVKSMYGAEKLPLFAERSAALERLKEIRTSNQMKDFIRKEKIDWYLLDPQTEVKWPEEILAHPVYETEGYRLYRFKSWQI